MYRLPPKTRPSGVENPVAKVDCVPPVVTLVTVLPVTREKVRSDWNRCQEPAGDKRQGEFAEAHEEIDSFSREANCDNLPGEPADMTATRPGPGDFET